MATKRLENEVPPWAAGASERMHELDPALTDPDFDVLRRYGEEKTFAAGETLWRAGERSDFYAVLDGELDVYRNTEDGEDVFITHGARHYPGEVISMTGGRALVSGRSRTALTAVVLSPDALRKLISTEADLGEKILHSFILRRMRMIAENLGNVRLLGRIETADASKLQSFLSRSGVPFDVVDPGDMATTTTELLRQHGVTEAELPALLVNDQLLTKPTTRQVAEHLGFTAEFDCGVTYDLAVIGSGPAGLASAVYAASEGLSVLVLESCAVGGQAGSSSKIENYLGFPTGISGQALTGRGYLQAQKFGAAVAIARELQGFERGKPLHKLNVDGGDIVYARSVVIATGAIYRQPALDRLDEIGGVHYGASHVEGQLCRGKDIAIVGGGNSAGQAAVYLSSRAKTVHILVRGPGLAASMSDYLVQRIDQIPNVHLHTHSEVASIDGKDFIESLQVRDTRNQALRQMAVSRLFIFIGALPGTQFVNGAFALDARNFVMTGDALTTEVLSDHKWPLERKPFPLETSCPRVFAVGDVRAGSVKRVASAVGEGSVCVQYVHSVLSEENEPGAKA